MRRDAAGIRVAAHAARHRRRRRAEGRTAGTTWPDALARRPAGACALKKRWSLDLQPPTPLLPRCCRGTASPTQPGLTRWYAHTQVKQVQLSDARGALNAVVCSEVSPPLVLVVLLPSPVSSTTADALGSQLARLLLFVHGPSASWAALLAAHPTALDPLLSVAVPQLTAHTPLALTLPYAVPYCHASAEVRATLAEALSDVRTYMPPVEQRLLARRGFEPHMDACLFHAGVLVATQMARAALGCVWALCNAHHLMARTEQHPRCVLLKDVWLPPSDATQPPQRRALVRVNRFLLAVRVAKLARTRPSITTAHH